MCFSVMIDRKLNRVANQFRAEVDRAAFLKFVKNSEEKPKLFKAPDQENRVYPNYFAPVIVLENQRRVLRPKRYQLLPHFCDGPKYRKTDPKTKRAKEIPTYNARLDSLEKRKAWSSIFMKKHCLFPFLRFFEWVEHEGQKKQIGFYPKKSEVMWAPGLYDRWESENAEVVIESFALITTEPRPEVLAMGHDRCPVFLKEESIDAWLSPQGRSKEEIYALLNQQESGAYNYAWV